MQGADDTDNCGVYASWVLAEWVQGNCVDEESVVDPLEFRHRILQLLRGAPRYHAEQVDDEDGGSSGHFIIGNAVQFSFLTDNINRYL